MTRMSQHGILIHEWKLELLSDIVFVLRLPSGVTYNECNLTLQSLNNGTHSKG